MGHLLRRGRVGIHVSFPRGGVEIDGRYVHRIRVKEDALVRRVAVLPVESDHHRDGLVVSKAEHM